MSERAKKSIGEDLVGGLFCILGGFFAVSIVMHWLGREPVVGFATQPVLALIALFGRMAALLLSLGVAGVGAWIFLSAQPPGIGRPLATIALAAAGFALVLGAFAWGGSLGDAFPGLVAGTPGRLIGAVLGVVVLFLAATLLPTRRSGASAADMMRVGLGSRGDLASGVSAAEAALLVTDTRSSPRPVARREEPVREPTLRPLTPSAVPRAAASVIATPAKPVPVAPAAAELPTPVTPAWENDEIEEERASAPLASADGEEDEAEAELAAELAQALTLEDEAEEEQEPEEEPESEPIAASAPPAASWEQVSLFDEEEEEEVVVEEPLAPASATLDFREAARPVHEPERATADDPFAAEPVTPPARPTPAFAAEPEEIEPEEVDEEDFEPEASEPEAEEAEPVAEPVAAQPPPAPRAPAPVEQPEFVLQPKPAVQKPEPVLAKDGERERWDKLVFDAGVAVLEQKRVAVSMLERRFGIDFDTACRVLDELQQAGLIGPYIGGRTRDILLSREQWLAQAHETA